MSEEQTKFPDLDYKWRDLGDGNPVRVKKCPMCDVAPSAVDDCGMPNPDCPYFGRNNTKQNEDVSGMKPFIYIEQPLMSNHLFVKSKIPVIIHKEQEESCLARDKLKQEPWFKRLVKQIENSKHDNDVIYYVDSISAVT